MIAFIYMLTIGTLLFALGACVTSALGKKEAANGALLGCWVLATVLFIANWVLAQAIPFGNMRHVLSFFPMVLIPAAFYMKRCKGIDLSAYFAAAAVCCMIGALCMPFQASWRQMPALQSPWFAPHVTSYVISYGFLTVSAILVLFSFFGAKSEERLSAADEVVTLAFPFLTFGLWSGAIWADEAWARYWAWDIKEAWALITWGVYLLYFHLRGQKGFEGWQRPLLLIGFAAVLITFFVVNLLPTIQSVHSYAQ